MIAWPPGLIKDIARRRAIVVIGSGVSRHSVGEGGVRPPTCKEFLLRALSDCPTRHGLSHINDAIEAGDYLHACEWIKKRFDESWVSYLRTTFSAPAFPPASIHNEILNLDCRIIFSLNFDDIYERHVNSIHHGSHIVKNYYDVDVSEFLRGDGRYIIKAHGTLHSPEKLIFSQKDYSRARVSNSSFYQAFDAALLTHTFVFIGSGYSDPDINLMLENQNFGFPSQNPHYLLSGTDYGDDRKISLRNNRGVKVIDYDPIDDSHTGLIDELHILNMVVETTRFEMASAANW